MFKCSECGAEYEIKPKYCDCGNNIFYETGIEIEDIDDIDDIDIDDLDEIEDFEEEIAPSKKRKIKSNSFSPVAIGVFAGCLILSFIVLFFIGNPKKEITESQNNQEEVVENIEIPSIDSYWDNSIAKSQEKQNDIKKEEEHPILNIVPKLVEQIIPQENKLPQKPKVTATVAKVPLKKTSQAPKIIPITPTSSNKTTTQTSTNQTHKTQNPVQNSNSSYNNLISGIKNNIHYTNNQTPQTKTTNSQSSHNTAQITQNSNNQAPLPSNKTTPAQINTTQPTKTTIHQTQNIITQPTKSTAQIKQELASYKSGLRNTIGRKIDFTRVIGDGECSLSFKVNSSGKLISKAFTKQSSNITLNDAAFNALNTTTSYNPPPEGYNGETMKLYIRFYNGNFEISLN